MKTITLGEKLASLAVPAAEIDPSQLFASG
jgi:hypothetical protein